MSDVRKLKELLGKIPYAVLIEVKDFMWCRNGNEIYWNEEFNSEDLYNGDGIPIQVGCVKVVKSGMVIW